MKEQAKESEVCSEDLERVDVAGSHDLETLLGVPSPV